MAKTTGRSNKNVFYVMIIFKLPKNKLQKKSSKINKL